MLFKLNEKMGQHLVICIVKDTSYIQGADQRWVLLFSKSEEPASQCTVRVWFQTENEKTT